MTMNELSNFLLHYGRVTSDISLKETCDDGTKYYVRIRTFVYNDKHYYHMMVNGEVSECFELK